MLKDNRAREIFRKCKKYCRATETHSWHDGGLESKRRARGSLHRNLRVRCSLLAFLLSTSHYEKLPSFHHFRGKKKISMCFYRKVSEGWFVDVFAFAIFIQTNTRYTAGAKLGNRSHYILLPLRIALYQ